MQLYPRLGAAAVAIAQRLQTHEQVLACVASTILAIPTPSASTSQPFDVGSPDLPAAPTSAPPATLAPSQQRRIWHNQRSAAHNEPLSWGCLPSALQSVRGIKMKSEIEYRPWIQATKDKYTTEPTNYLQLLGAINAAPGLERLKYLVQRYGGVFHGQHLAAALARLPKLAKYKESDLQARHIVTVTDRDTGGDALKTIMWPRKGAEIRPGYRAAAGAMATQLLAVLVGQENVKLAHDVDLGQPHGKAPSLWRLKGSDLQGGAPGKAASDLKEGQPMTEYMSVRDIATTVHAVGVLATIGVPINRGLVKRAVDECVAVLTKNSYTKLKTKGTTADIAMLWKGVAQARVGQRPMELLHVLSDLTLGRIDELSGKQVQMILRAVSSLGYRSPLLTDALATRATHTVKDFSPHGIAATLQAFAATNPNSPASQTAMAALADGVIPQATMMTHDDLASLAQALQRLGSGLQTGATGSQLGRTTHSGTFGGSLGMGSSIGVDSNDSISETGLASEGRLDIGSISSVQGASEGVPNPRGLPGWLHGLVCFLADKAARDIRNLSPAQLAAVLDMLAKLQVPHGRLLRAAVDGVLGEDRLDPKLPGPPAVSFIRATHTLTPLLTSTQDINTPLLPSPPELNVSERERKVIISRQTGMGLGNLPRVDMTVGDSAIGIDNNMGTKIQSLDTGVVMVGSTGSVGLDTGVGFTEEGMQLAPLVPPPAPGAGPDPLEVAARAVRQSYLALLTEGAPFARRADAAVWRVLALFARPGALEERGLEDLTVLAELCTSVDIEGLDYFKSQLANESISALQGIQEEERQSNQAPAFGRAAKDLDLMARLLQSVFDLGHASGPLAAAASGYLEHTLSHSTDPARLLPLAVRLVTQIQRHDAGDKNAVRAVSTAYAAVSTARGAPASRWPTHTASGLAPPAPPAAARAAPTSAAYVLSGVELGALLAAAESAGELDDKTLHAATVQIHDMLSLIVSQSSAARAEAHLDWMLACATPLIKHADKQGQRVGVEVTETLSVLVTRAKELADMPGTLEETRDAVRALEQSYDSVRR